MSITSIHPGIEFKFNSKSALLYFDFFLTAGDIAFGAVNTIERYESKKKLKRSHLFALEYKHAEYKLENSPQTETLKDLWGSLRTSNAQSIIPCLLRTYSVYQPRLNSAILIYSLIVWSNWEIDHNKNELRWFELQSTRQKPDRLCRHKIRTDMIS